MINLYDYQLEAVKKMHNGCILNGGVGSGKSRTALYYYYISYGGGISNEKMTRMKNPENLFIITTARKRDTLEWETELVLFGLTSKEENKLYSIDVKVDSWNNIKKYEDVENSFFIFDEDRVIGKGAWVKAFLKITKKNKWIILSATPGDTWSDYIPVFIANGFYKNRTQFNNEHVIWNRFAKYPKVDKYVGTKKLYFLKNKVLVSMDFDRETFPIDHVIHVDYDKYLYHRVMKDRWNVFTEQPVVNAAELCFTLRKVINSNLGRMEVVEEIVKEHKKVIIFYNYNYELDLLKGWNYQIDNLKIAEWNGTKHEKIPDGEHWIYLVQYTAGAEGWNCIITDTIIFFSQNYSYRTMCQAKGRIDRVNTPFKELHYYYIKTHAGIDLAIDKALRQKKKFNESKFAGDW